MDADKMAIPRPPHIQFKTDSQLEASPEVRQGVLGSVKQQAAMRDDERRTWAGTQCGAEYTGKQGKRNQKRMRMHVRGLQGRLDRFRRLVNRIGAQPPGQFIRRITLARNLSRI